MYTTSAYEYSTRVEILARVLEYSRVHHVLV